VSSEHTIRDERGRQRIVQYLQGVDISKPIKITIAPAKSSRSLAQNRLLWMWNSLIQQHMADSFGQHASAEQWHDVLVSRLCPAELSVIEMPDGFKARVGRSRTSKFTVDQMGEYLDRLDAYCAENLNLLLPHPDDYELAVYGVRK